MTLQQDTILTAEMQKAMRLIRTSRQPLFITGKAGTGKTTLLKYITAQLGNYTAVTAPTGIAAINAGGTTLHSLFNIPFGAISPDNHSKIHRLPAGRSAVIKALKVLIIDEISMVRPDVLDFVDWRLRTERMSSEPFGGVQLIMFGDLFQLPPVVKKEEEEMLENFYDGEYFFYSRAILKSGMNVIELTTVFRQTEDRFINILNRIRDYSATEDDLEDLCELRSLKATERFDGKTIHICTHKSDVKKINDEQLGKPDFFWCAEYDGDFKKNDAPCDETLSIKNGARVMTILNNSQAGYVNGSLGMVTGIRGTLDKPAIEVLLDNGNLITVGVETWESVDYKAADDGSIERIVKGKCRQFPIILAWAITVHKSQGLTFDDVALHIKRTFCSGQVYVALSRCRSMAGISTDVFVKKYHIIPDLRLVAFEKLCREYGNSFNAEVMRKMRKEVIALSKK